MLAEVMAWLVIGLLVVSALHEATHVAIARLHGHPTVCIVINPIGVGILFEDAPHVGYWSLQIIAPALVTWAGSYIWLSGLFGALATYTPLVPLDDVLQHLPWTISLLTLLTSGGDFVAGCVDMTHPVSGRTRVHQGLASLKVLPSLVLFTAHGRRHWRETWVAIRTDAAAITSPAI